MVITKYILLMALLLAGFIWGFTDNENFGVIFILLGFVWGFIFFVMDDNER